MSVPVLSVAITLAEPSVSTADSRRTIAPRAAMERAPWASAIVTAAASPSGTAATATETPTRKASCRDEPRSSIPAASRVMTAPPSASMSRESEARRRWSGVGGGVAAAARRAIWPSSVRTPVALTITVARPRVTPVPA